MATLEQRLHRLERDLVRSRRFNRLIVVTVLAFACFAGAQRPQHDQTNAAKPRAEAIPSQTVRGEDPAVAGPRVLYLEELVLSDRQARPRIRLRVSPDGPAISLLDEQGQERLQLSQSRAGSTIAMRDRGQPVVTMQLDHQNGVGELELRGPQGTSVLNPAGMSIRDASDQQRIYLSLLNGSFPVLGLNASDQVGSPAVELTASESVRGLKIHDRAGRPLFAVVAGEDGSALVNLQHPRQDRTLQISNGDGALEGPSLAFFAPANEDGSGGSLPRLQLGLGEDGGGRFRIVGRDGRAQFTAPPP